jgi:hypothetical protein
MHIVEAGDDELAAAINALDRGIDRKAICAAHSRDAATCHVHSHIRHKATIARVDNGNALDTQASRNWHLHYRTQRLRWPDEEQQDRDQTCRTDQQKNAPLPESSHQCLFRQISSSRKCQGGPQSRSKFLQLRWSQAANEICQSGFLQAHQAVTVYRALMLQTLGNPNRDLRWQPQNFRKYRCTHHR